MVERKGRWPAGKDGVTIKTHALVVTVSPRGLFRIPHRVTPTTQSIEEKKRVMSPGSLPILMLMAKNAFPESYGVGDADYSFAMWEKQTNPKGNTVTSEDFRKVCSELRRNNWTLHEVAGVILDNVHSIKTAVALGTMTKGDYEAKRSLIMAEIALFWNPPTSGKKERK